MESKKKKNIGRPLKFKTPEILQKKIDGYFDWCDKEDKPYGVCGLAVHLETARQVLLDYADKSQFADIIKKAKTKIESQLEEKLTRNSGVTAGVIFVLCNNHGWHQTQDRRVVGDLNVAVSGVGLKFTSNKKQDIDECK